MAQTLGSLIDALTIKDIREFHLRLMLEAGVQRFSKAALRSKLAVLAGQKKQLIFEIDGYIAVAAVSRLALRDEKLKLYNPKDSMGRIPLSPSIAEAISGLARKNLELWHLEDEARRTDVSLSYIGKIKKKIDFANQQRNDFIDRIDELFENIVRKPKK